MTITENPLTSLADSTNAASYATPSVTPGANRLILVAVENNRIGGATTPTLSGNGLTWVAIDNQPFSATNNYLITLFRSMGASPSTGAITADFGGVNQTGCAISVAEFDGVDTSGTNGSGAVVQSAKNSGLLVASLTVTLAAFGDVNNGAYSCFGANITGGIAPDTGWSEIHDVTYTIPNTELETQWRNDNDTTAVGTPAVGADMGGIAIEIKAAAVAGRSNQYLPLVGVG